jgi:hypothetical protein
MWYCNATGSGSKFWNILKILPSIGPIKLAKIVPCDFEVLMTTDEILRMFSNILTFPNRKAE